MLLPLMTIMNYHENYRGEHGHKKKTCRRVAEALHRLLFGLLRRSFRVLHLGPVAGAAWGRSNKVGRVDG